MPRTRRTRISLAFCAACLWLTVSTAPTVAAGPATVTVRVEGLSETRLLATPVTTTTEPVIAGGNPAQDSCPGTSVLGALQVATNGNWSGPWSASYDQYEVYSIDGESHPFGSGAYWDLFIDHASSNLGACEAPAEAGDELLFAACPETVAECPTLGIQAPASAQVGESVPVTVSRYNSSAEATPAAGVEISGASSPAATEAAGHANVSFAAAGTFTLRASASATVRSETTICVHSGDDGSCGTPSSSGPGGSESSSGSSSSAGATTGSGAGRSSAGANEPAGGVLGASVHRAAASFEAAFSGLLEHHHYSRDNAPRLLAGRVTAPSPVTAIALRLRRYYRGRCWAYSGAREAFARVRCREGSFFKIASHGDSFSYLLPSRLPSGRYVFDARATDAAGGLTTLARGLSRFVFYVD